jgi:uncharacterized membrane protein|tara:strand:- start:1899 stop:2168 length:270 start_codon:yes stop_codon:yes gene_type:complete
MAIVSKNEKTKPRSNEIINTYFTLLVYRLFLAEDVTSLIILIAIIAAIATIVNITISDGSDSNSLLKKAQNSIRLVVNNNEAMNVSWVN